MANTTGTVNVAQNVLVQVQTLRGNAGIAAAMATVEAAVKTHNAANSKSTAHVAQLVTPLANNTKGMAFQLALLATLARKHGANMIRLSVHNGNVALCGTPAAIKAVQDALVPAVNEYGTMVANAYNPSAHGNRVGFVNGFLCGCAAGLQVAHAIAPTLAYGVGFLFTFPAPGTGTAYAMGQRAAIDAAKVAMAKPVKAVKAASAKPTAKETNIAAHEAAREALAQGLRDGTVSDVTATYTEAATGKAAA